MPKLKSLTGVIDGSLHEKETNYDTWDRTHNRGARKLMGDNLKLVWAKFSAIS
jgi:hypothetical protein